MKPTKRFSNLMRDVSSNSHENYYCHGAKNNEKCSNNET